MSASIELRQQQFQRLLRKRYLICLDVEATCSDDSTVPREEMEVIEVGASVLDRDNNWEEKFRIEFFIKPILHPTLTDFCKNLTHISQEQVDVGKSYVEALEVMRGFTDGIKDFAWCSWGAFDKNIFIQDGELHGLSPLLPPEAHFNLKVWYSNLKGFRKGFGLDKAIAKEGLTFVGQHHRALSDAQNVAQIFRRMYEGVSQRVSSETQSG